MNRVDRHVAPYAEGWNPASSYSGGALTVERKLGQLPSAIYVGNYSGNKQLNIEFENGSQIVLKNPRKGGILPIGSVAKLLTGTTIADLCFLYRV